MTTQQTTGGAQLWQSVRYILILFGGYLAGKGKLPATEVEPFADAIIQIAGFAIALGSAAWGLYVRYKTVSVPVQTAANRDLPVVSSATGKVT